MDRAKVDVNFSSNCNCDELFLDLRGIILSALNWACGLSGSH